MITLSNGYRLDWLVASGALGFDGRGYLWEWPLRWLGKLDPKSFTIITKTLMFDPRKGNLRWYAPWRVVKFLNGEGKVVNSFSALRHPELVKGAVNAIGLTGPGILQWREKDYPIIKKNGYKIIVSFTGSREDCLETVRILNGLDIEGVEYNISCPNVKFLFHEDTEEVIETCRAVKKISRHPVLLKLGYSQPYLEIAKQTEGLVEAISLNSVPWREVFPDKESPLAKYGGGGVSGFLAQPFTWKMLRELAREAKTPIIGASISDQGDIGRLKSLGASAVHFGTMFLLSPAKPNKIIARKAAF